jgi:hypothetical protein
MKFCSMNIRGLGGRAKKLSLLSHGGVRSSGHFDDARNHGGSESLIVDLVKLFPGWEFVGRDSMGISSGSNYWLVCKL